ncbi:cupin domain-containing protein [Caldovatus aquaticus]|uniref:Cupin domain-containing protein n=1 Tax=Caldovatus aquaticus TaxID=2865671 RepID=A0ABS7EXW0_9PROT|nr:cupin domain-containing protein [Caldovatus aquaticus]MBW8268201.1 cupin domain-containing protein [Caldovatus aquaticus]
MRDIVRGSYPLEKREVVMEGADMRASVLTLAPGQCVPWHYHSEVTDVFFCLEGPMVVETRAPREERVLRAGESLAVPPKTAHLVHGLDGGRCRFLLLQGVGDYDFRAVAGA